jgi:aminoglycoside/choline kinase family phosphotransferase
VVRYGRERKENERYVQNARFLKRIGLSVPDIRMYRPDERWMVVEDVGDVALLDVMDRHTAEALYGDVLDSVAVLHVRGTRLARRTGLRLEAKFSRKLYRWEHELFEEHFLTGRLGMKRDAIALLLDDLKEVSRRLLKEPGVLIHRDLQSSNIHLFEGRMVFLDFQGMRFGSSSYDLASLLCDPYAMLSERLQERLLECYADLVKARLTAVRDMFWLAAVQRLVQAIGAYSRLGAARGTERFLCYVEPALRMLERALGHVNGQCRLKQVVCYALKKEE